MNRRQYLTATGVALAGISAGCVVDDTEDQPTAGGDGPAADRDGANKPDSDSSGDEKADEDKQPERNDGDKGADSGPDSSTVAYDFLADEINDNRPLTHDLRVTHRQLRDEQRPLTLELTLTNRSSETVSYGEQRDALGLDAHAERFVLLAPGGEFYGFEDGWWSKTTEIVRTMEYRIGTLGPGESETVRRVVVADDIEQNPSQPPERLRFELSYSAGPQGVDMSEWTDYGWGFELVAEDTS